MGGENGVVSFLLMGWTGADSLNEADKEVFFILWGSSSLLMSWRCLELRSLDLFYQHIYYACSNWTIRHCGSWPITLHSRGGQKIRNTVCLQNYVKERTAKKYGITYAHITSQQKQITLYFLHGYCIALWIIICHIKYCCVLPAEVLRGRTGSGSEAPSTLGVKPGTTAVAVLISLSRLLTPWVDSFHRLPMPCVDSLRRWDTEGPPPRVTAPFRSLLSMLMANRMEFRP